MLYINGFVSTSSTNKWRVFFSYQWIRVNELYKLMKNFFQIGFRNFGRKPKNIQTGVNIDQIAICYISWIWLDKVHKLMESFYFQISESFFELVTIF